MSLHGMGAGLARTGTASLKLALEQLLGGPCYHMSDVFANLEHIPVRRCAARGQPPPWNAVLDGYRAAVDVPAAAFWQELADADPDALILLSLRESPGQWRESVSRAMLHLSTPKPPPGTGFAEYTALAVDLRRTDLGRGDLEWRALDGARSGPVVTSGLPA